MCYPILEVFCWVMTAEPDDSNNYGPVFSISHLSAVCLLST